LNVLMVLADQHHAGLMGCAGHKQVQTPHIDAFAQQGIRFDNAYCQNPICTPSRVSILSGQYCHNHGYYGLSGPAPFHLSNAFRHFRQHGYRTAGFGKLHLPESPHNWVADDLDYFGDSYESADGVIGRSAYLTELDVLGLRHLEDSWHNFTGHYFKGSIPLDARPSDMPYEHTQEVWCAREAMKFMAEESEQPFFVQIAFQKPHHPLLPVQKFWDQYEEDVDLPPSFEQDPSHRPPHFQRMWQQMRNRKWEYAKDGETYEDGARRMWRGTLACISQLDDVFGSLLSFLDENGLAENTIVIYGSDHGCYHTIHGIPEKAPGIGSDAVGRVPMIWRVPNKTVQGRVSKQLVENIDMAPTLASLCNLPEMDWVNGEDISGLLAGDETPVREAAFTENALSKSVRFGPWRMTYYPKPVFDGEYEGELYHLEDDPDETMNLYQDAGYQDVVIQGKNHVIDWLASSRRVVTTQPTIFEGPHRDRKRGYTISSDGRAPRMAQPLARLKDDRPINYI